MSRTLKVGFFGLGAMGYPIAANLARTFEVFVWNRSLNKAKQHSKENGSHVVESLETCREFDYILTCLPTLSQVSEVLLAVRPHVSSHTVFVDITSGDLLGSQVLAEKLKPNRYMDAPVSGGPAGAQQGVLTSMVGNDGPLLETDLRVLSVYSSKIVQCGQVGHGNAVKAANNFLNISHLALAADVLIQLKKVGVSTEAALSAINTSSGRSLQTEERIPTEVMSRRFNYGFKLNLMRKDVLQSEPILRNCMFYDTVSGLLQPHAESEADYTFIVRDIEDRNSTTLP